MDPALGQFKAVHLQKGGACLEYEVAGVPIKEWIEARLDDGVNVVQRGFEVGGREEGEAAAPWVRERARDLGEQAGVEYAEAFKAFRLLDDEG